MTLNFQEQVHGSLMRKYVQHIRRHPDVPLMVMEFWSGWFDHWGTKHEVWPLEGTPDIEPHPELGCRDENCVLCCRIE